MPLPEQLFTIAKLGICLAKKQGKLRESKQAENAHVFLAEDLDYIEVYDEEDYRRTIHKFIGRIGRIGFRHWSMRLAEPYWMSSAGSEDGYRAAYKFEWTDKEVMVAKRRMHAKADPEDVPYEAQVLVQNPLIVEPDFLYAVDQFETISRADCDELIHDVQAFVEESRKIMR